MIKQKRRGDVHSITAYVETSLYEMIKAQAKKERHTASMWMVVQCEKSLREKGVLLNEEKANGVEGSTELTSHCDNVDRVSYEKNT